MKAFWLKLALGKEMIDLICKYRQFRKPYSQEGRKLSPAERQDLLKEVWPILMAILNILENKKDKKMISVA